MKLFENKVKKILAIGSICVLALLSACGDDNSDFATQPSGDSSSSVKEITVTSSSSRDDKSSSSSVKSSSSSSDSGPAEVTEGSLTDSRDGQTYKTVKIGDIWWMAENLNYAYTGVPFNYDGNTSDSTSWCYNNNASNCTKYGRLYTWAAAMDSVGTWSTNGKGCGYKKTCSPTYPVRGVCPEGWSLPTVIELRSLFVRAGGQLTAHLALNSQTGWDRNGNGNDVFGFSALPAGYRTSYGRFESGGTGTFFWCASGDYFGSSAYYMTLGYFYESSDLREYDKYYGFSVRCIKD